MIQSLLKTSKVRSIECFRTPVPEACAGDRVGIGLGSAGFDTSLIERSVVAADGYVKPLVRAGLISLNRVQFFKKPIKSKKRYLCYVKIVSTKSTVLNLFCFIPVDTIYQSDMKPLPPRL